ncbi:glucocorticoid-induced transcript 1 protein-like isoform X2 [Engraulis encrasicolus]|uniref:glucocorticoid-induced transcript 1 protein-like isoform X2 n=1 Tax=Engraulis encrasicolus TaxID=184585 RepID=UPI002FCED4B7
MSATSDTNCHFQQQQRLRLGSAGSPGLPNNSGGRLQPIRATVPYQLLRGGQQSPPRVSSVGVGTGNGAGPALCLSCSPPGQKHLSASIGGNATVDLRLAGMQRLSPESRSPPERCTILTHKAERPVLPPLVRAGPTVIRRTSSLDTVTASVTGPYLTGQWPRDCHSADLTSWTRDKATQTSGLWGEDKGDLGCIQQRSASWGSENHLREITKLRQQLKKQGVRSCREEKKEKEKETGPSKSSSLALPKAPFPPSATSKPLAFRVPSYTEAINHELETVFINDEWEREDLTLLEVQDGRRAPFPPHRHDSSSGCSSNSSSSSSSHNSSHASHSGSRRSTEAQAGSSSCCSSPWCCHTPSTPATPASASASTSPYAVAAAAATTAGEGGGEGGEGGPLDSQTSSPAAWLLEDQDKDSRGGSPLPKYATSPRPNNSFMFKREPPEGCEKVKVFEESAPLHRSIGFPLFSCPDKNKVNFIPTGSAFCPVKMPGCSSLLTPRSSVPTAAAAAAAATGAHTADLVPGSTSPSGDRMLPSGPGTH